MLEPVAPLVRPPPGRPCAPGPRRPAGDVVLFRACLVVAAAAVADDAFLHPEHGVGPPDHLASGLIPLAVAAALIWAAPRLAPALRGWLAVAAGALAVMGGVADGVRHVLVDRLSGDDL